MLMTALYFILPARITTMRNTILSQTNSHANGIYLETKSSQHVAEKEVTLHAVTSSSAPIHHDLLVQSLRLESDIAMRRVMQRQVIIWDCCDHVLMQHFEKGMVQNRFIAHVEFLRDLKMFEEPSDLGFRING